MTTTQSKSAPGLQFFALPDDRTLQVRLNSAGNAEFTRHNMLVLPQAVKDALSRNATDYWHPAPAKVPTPRPKWIVNACTDPDTFSDAMTWLNETYGSDTPIFNHPQRLAQTARDRQAQRLDGITGLTVPRCVRLTFETKQDLIRVFEEGGFRFPVLVRPNELQTGQGLQRVDSHDEWEKLLYTRWFRKEHMMIQFEDSQTETGTYLKARVVFIAGKPFLRHVKAGSNWLVHNAIREAIDGFPERELDVIDALEADPSFMAICEEIGARVGLDFCGADFGVDPDNGNYVLFEANPSMNVFFPLRDNLSKAELARRERLQERAADALLRHVQDPGQWTGPGQ